MRSLLASVIVAVVLASGAVGCDAPYLPPRAPSAPAEHGAVADHRSGFWKAPDGTRLFEQAWTPHAPLRGVLVVVHGLKDHSGRYAALAEALAEKGIAVRAFDLRGHGRSEGVRVATPSFETYLDDVDAFIHRVRAEQPGPPTFLFGHSMGGAIATLETIERRPPIAGLALSGAALQVDAPAPKIAGTRVMNALCPDAGLFQLDLNDFSRDEKVVDEAQHDPLVYQDPAPVHTAVELVGAIGRIQAHMEDVAVPLLAMHGGADVVTPPDGSRALVKRARATDKTLKIYDGLYHDILHEPERARVTKDLVDWLDAHALRAPG